MRLAIALLACAGCDISFGLLHFGPADPADPVDASPPLVDAIAIDAEVPLSTGCADGTREGFDNGDFSQIAACAGGWTLPGLEIEAIGGACLHSGNSSGVDGVGCTAADLCAPGWQICSSFEMVAANIRAANCDDQIVNVAFFTANQPATNGVCSATGDNDLFGCGKDGALASNAECGPLTRTSSDHCSALQVGGWMCSTGSSERSDVTKTDPAFGGVLCCID